MDQERENYAEPGKPTYWRRIRQFVALFLSLILVAIFLELAYLPHRYTQEQANQILPGMTPTEVENVLGRPPDERGDDGGDAWWNSRGTTIGVIYQDGRVAATSFESSDPPSFLERWRRHLGLSR